VHSLFSGTCFFKYSRKPMRVTKRNGTKTRPTKVQDIIVLSPNRKNMEPAAKGITRTAPRIISTQAVTRCVWFILFCLTSKVSRDYGWRDSCAAGVVTAMVVGSSAWLGVFFTPGTHDGFHIWRILGKLKRLVRQGDPWLCISRPNMRYRP